MYQIKTFDCQARTLVQAFRQASRSMSDWLESNQRDKNNVRIIEVIDTEMISNQEHGRGVMYEFEVCILLTYRML